MPTPHRHLPTRLESLVRRRHIPPSTRQSPRRTRIKHDGFPRSRPLRLGDGIRLSHIEQYGWACVVECDFLGGDQGFGVLSIAWVE